MPAIEQLATHLVAEVPVTRLQALLRRNPVDEPMFDGILCGGNCTGKDGAFCGSGCGPHQAAEGIIDRDGRLGLTAKDLSDIRYDIPALRRAVIGQLDVQLARLK